MSILDLNRTFLWFVGTVVDVDDPLQIGRVKVRALPFYNDAADDDLPWAQCMQPIQSAAKAINGFGVGISPTGILVGSSVMGFFLDGELAQQPLILGTFAGKDDVSGLAQGENILPERARSPFEPSTSYGAAYPFNKVITTTGGHAIEIDDTDGAERIHIYHREGSYFEMRPDGSVIYKADGNRYDITTKSVTGYVGEDFKLFIDGMARIQVNGEVQVYAGGTATVSSLEKIILAAPDIEINGPVQFDPVGDAAEQEAFDMGDDAPAITQEAYVAVVAAAGGTITETTVVEANTPANNVESTIVSCTNYTVTSPAVVSLSSGALMPHTIPSAGKSWTGRGFSGQLTAQEIACNLGGLHENVVKRLFDQFGADKFTINSGYRTGHGGSQHDSGQACDIQIKAGTGFGVGAAAQTKVYADWIRANCDFDQLAMEYSSANRLRCWIHVSYIRPGGQYTLGNRKAIYTWDSAQLGRPGFSVPNVFNVRT